MPLRRRLATVAATSPRGATASVRAAELPPRSPVVRAPLRPGGPPSSLVAGQRAVAHEVAEVGQHPGGRRLDEQVVVALLDSLAYQVELLGHDGEQGAQRFALLGVAQPVPLGQQVGESVRIPGHHTASVSNWTSADITAVAAIT